MAHTAETYREAAIEHANLARELHADGEYGAAHYWAGLAVECLCRAFIVRQDALFDSRHDLRALSRRAGLHDLVPADQQAELGAALTVVALRWRNDHRYRPARMVARWLHAQRLDSGVKGDPLKYSSAEIVEAALQVVTIGGARWTRRSSGPTSGTSSRAPK